MDDKNWTGSRVSHWVWSYVVIGLRNLIYVSS